MKFGTLSLVVTLATLWGFADDNSVYAGGKGRSGGGGGGGGSHASGGHGSGSHGGSGQRGSGPSSLARGPNAGQGNMSSTNAKIQSAALRSTSLQGFKSKPLSNLGAGGVLQQPGAGGLSSHKLPGNGPTNHNGPNNHNGQGNQNHKVHCGTYGPANHCVNSWWWGCGTNFGTCWNFNYGCYAPWYYSCCSPCDTVVYQSPLYIAPAVTVVAPTNIDVDVVNDQPLPSEAAISKRLQLISGEPVSLGGESLTSNAGQVVLQLGDIAMPITIKEWSNDRVNGQLPRLALAKPVAAQLHVVRADGSLANSLDFDLLPPNSPAVVSK